MKIFEETDGEAVAPSVKMFFVVLVPHCRACWVSFGADRLHVAPAKKVLHFRRLLADWVFV